MKFLYEIWDCYNQVLFDVNFSDFSPFIRLWIVFLDWITKTSISFLIPKLTNISYEDMQNLSSPPDCIQFLVSDNKRMMLSCIIHISDSRNSTVNWSWECAKRHPFFLFLSFFSSLVSRAPAVPPAPFSFESLDQIRSCGCVLFFKSNKTICC